MEANVKRREWVKTAAIIFLAVLLVLTFFSNTIMNHSLPEVATQSVQSGTINAKIRGSGTVAANETYDVTINQTRKIASVLVKVGQSVEAGDKLFTLDSMESSDLTNAKNDLETMELAYEKSLIDASNAAAKDNREVQKAQKAYNEALALCKQFSNLSASQIAQEKASAELKKKQMERELADLNTAKTNAEKDKTDASAGITGLQTEVDTVGKLKDAVDTLKADQYLYKTDYDNLRAFAAYLLAQGTNAGQDIDQIAAALAKNQSRYDAEVQQHAGQYINENLNVTDFEGKYKTVSSAYTTIVADQAALDALNPNEMNYDITTGGVVDNAKVDRVYNSIFTELQTKQNAISKYDTILAQYDASITTLSRAIEDQGTYIEDLGSAQTYADQAKAAKETLEELMFNQGLANTSDLDMQASKEAIEKKKEEIKKLEEDADGGDVTAKVSGVISAINVTAGNSIGPDQALATIQVVDRGYTVKISVTTDQAKKVRVGDKADLVNYWGGDLEATLENIANDPANPGKGKLLVFRLTGDVEPDTNLTLSIGQKSANYDALVPNSAVRSDSNGSFVLAVVVKSSPLGNRYTATRVDVKVLASDDTMSAVSGVSAGDFVITTSTKPIEAGTLVRLAENG